MIAPRTVLVPVSLVCFVGALVCIQLGFNALPFVLVGFVSTLMLGLSEVL